MTKGSVSNFQFNAKRIRVDQETKTSLLKKSGIMEILQH